MIKIILGLPDHLTYLKPAIEASLTKDVIDKIVSLKEGKTVKDVTIIDLPDNAFSITIQISYFKNVRKLSYTIEPDNPDTADLLFYITYLCSAKEKNVNWPDGIIHLTFESSVK